MFVMLFVILLLASVIMGAVLWNQLRRAHERLLRGQSPEALYERDRELAGGRLDPCVLYTYRCAVYYASTERPDPALLKWWNWKDRASV